MSVDTMTQFKIMKSLDAVCKKDSEGFAVYKSKCSDKSVAEEFGVNVATVASYRKKLIGNLRIGPTKGGRGRKKGTKNVKSVIRDLQGQVEAIEGQLQHVLALINAQQISAEHLAKEIKQSADSQDKDDESIHARETLHLP